MPSSQPTIKPAAQPKANPASSNSTSAEPKPINGGRNLAILGIASIALALLTTSISLVIYHNSGDIYLDRSRPGFLPDEKEEGIKETNFTFAEEGAIDQNSLSEYLENIKTQLDNLERLGSPYDPNPLSDDSLGIPVPDTIEQAS